MSSAEKQLLLVEDLFHVSAIDPDGKKFDRVSRIKATGENLGMDLTLDVNCELYPIRVNDRLTVALSKTLNLDGSPSDDASYCPSPNVPSLADGFEYVMYGRLFKFENTSQANKLYTKTKYYSTHYILEQFMCPLEDFYCDWRLNRDT